MSEFKEGDVIVYVGREDWMTRERAGHECTVGQVMSNGTLFVHVKDLGFVDNSPASNWKHADEGDPR